MELNLDVSSLTIDDVVDLEAAVGQPISDIFSGDGSAPQGKALKALVWIAKRKEDPSFSFEDAGRLSFADLGGMEVESADLDPIESGGLISS